MQRSSPSEGAASRVAPIAGLLPLSSATRRPQRHHVKRGGVRPRIGVAGTAGDPRRRAANGPGIGPIGDPLIREKAPEPPGGNVKDPYCH